MKRVVPRRRKSADAGKVYMYNIPLAYNIYSICRGDNYGWKLKYLILKWDSPVFGFSIDNTYTVQG